jgi:LysM repeat protein
VNGRKIPKFILTLLLVGVFSLIIGGPAHARPTALTGYDLVGAVNNLRAGEGLTPLEVNGSLMAISQAHAEYMAKSGVCAHTGASGNRPRDRALAVGYGGGSDVVISENIACYTDPDLQVVLYQTWADEAHWNTMTKSTYTHIGGGVAVVRGKTYLTIDTGWVRGVAPAPTSPPKPAGTQPAVNPTQQDSNQEIQIEPVWVATPLSDGSILHIVQSGQALWNIASAYKTTVGDLVTLNNLSASNPVIHPGQEILVRPPQPATLTPTHTLEVIALARTPTITPDSYEPAAARPAPQEPKDNTATWIIITIAAGMAGLIAVSLFHR